MVDVIPKVNAILKHSISCGKPKGTVPSRSYTSCRVLRPSTEAFLL